MELKFSPQNLSRQDPSHQDLNLENFQSLQAERTAKSESKEVGMKLKTKEGDIVTLSLSSNFESELNTYSSIQKNNHNIKKNGTSQNLEFSSEYEISVEGDLNKEELKDLNKAIRKLDKTMKSMAEGDMGKALHKAMSIGNLNSVDSFETNLSYLKTEEYNYHQQSVYQSAAKTANEPLELTDENKSLLEQQTDDVAEKAKKARLPEEKALSSIKQLFSNMKSKMEKAQKNRSKNPWDNFLSQLQNRFEENLFQTQDADFSNKG